MKFLFVFLMGVATFVSFDIKADEQPKQDNVLHIYSSRHYNTDEALYENFTNETGIKIERVDGKGDALISRLKQEGEKTPADLFITVDAGRLWRAQNAGLFQPIDSDILDLRIPEYFQDVQKEWYGFSSRARVIVVNEDNITEGEINTYEDLTNPKWKENICIRTSSNIYNVSLMASMIAIKGKDEASDWAEALQSNLARKPQGGDTDQIKAVSAGVCDIAVVNSYYFYRLARSEKQQDRDIIKGLKVIYPNQNTTGTHVNISGAGVLKHADNKDAAINFLEYLTTNEAQKYFADGNNEYPVVNDIDYAAKAFLDNDFKKQEVNVSLFGKHQKDAMMVFDMIAFP